ncbi:MAG: hypothetical protein UU93_C0023G0008 [Candidatus Amesbacteria bacterium GW2011_GWA2_42_12]|uniref:Phosphoribosyltransferase domain-containing protein n=1 Tax=Candidatus Amesbacteria bacterium GW2011_GWA2_42_12 TaxID=1618356 RepID=A0A0G1AAD5_9BACT|nr:MAG: hypothetical protein UU93_C0023G0008 [Candidatus Amesbacteria bacterium GW2011_GWA2_42_12]
MRFFEFSVCPACDHPTLGGKTHEVCRTPYGLDGLIAIAQYEEPVSLLIKKVKYRYVSDAVDEIVEIFLEHWPSYAPKFDMLIPIPMHAKKQNIRGFNQAQKIGEKLGDQLKIEVRTDILRKTLETAPQASLKLKERKMSRNLGFIYVNPEKIRGKIVGVVDDVATTRTTLQLAGKVLKENGVKEVWGVVFAHRF